MAERDGGAPASMAARGGKVVLGTGFIAAAIVCCAVPVAGVACVGVAMGVVGGLELARNRHVRWLLAALLVVAAGVFAVGVGVEKSHHHHEAATPLPTPVTVAGAVGAEGSSSHEAAEGTGGVTSAASETGTGTTAGSGSESSSGSESGSESTSGSESSSESTESKVLGINTESTPVVILVVLGSLALAGLLLRRPGRTALGATVVVAGLAAVFDLAELAHQRHLGEHGLAFLAAVVAGLHLAAAILAGWVWWSARGSTASLATPPVEHPSLV